MRTSVILFLITFEKKTTSLSNNTLSVCCPNWVLTCFLLRRFHCIKAPHLLRLHLLNMGDTWEEMHPHLKNNGFPSPDDEVAYFMSQPVSIMAWEVPIPPRPTACRWCRSCETLSVEGEPRTFLQMVSDSWWNAHFDDNTRIIQTKVQRVQSAFHCWCSHAMFSFIWTTEKRKFLAIWFVALGTIQPKFGNIL